MAYLLADASSDISRLMALVQQLGSEEAPRLQHLPLCTGSFYHHQNRNKADNRYFAFSPKGATCEVILYLCSPCGVFWRPTKPPKTPANSPGEQGFPQHPAPHSHLRLPRAKVQLPTRK